MKIKHIKHNACRLLSLLLVVAALSGLLTVGAWAATYEQNTMTLSVEVSEPTSAGYVQAKIYASGRISASEAYESGYSDGVLGGTFGVTVPEGLEFVSLSGNSTKNYSEKDSKVWGQSLFGSTMPYQFAILMSDNSEDTNPETFQTYKITSWLGGDKVLFATAVFKVKDGAYGDQVIGISDDTVFYRGDTANTPVNLVKQSATLSLPKVTLTFSSSKGTAPAAQEMAKGSKPSMPSPAPTFPGYTFDGWYANEVCTTPFDFDQPLNENSWAFAKWTPKTYTVTFDVSGGNELADADKTKSVTYDSTYGTLPTPTRAGYKFGGWYLGETLITDASRVATADDHTLVASWSEKAMIGFDMTPQQFAYDETIAYVPAPFVFGGTAPTDGYTVHYIENGVETTTPPTAIGSYDVKITRAEDDTYQAVNQTLESALVITKKLVTEPTQGESQWTYDVGTPRNFEYTPGDTSAYTVTADSVTTGTNAGTYTITFQLKDKDNYQWEDQGDSEDLVFTYIIHKYSLPKPALTQNSFDYDGTPKTVSLTPSDTRYELVASTATATDAGIHRAKVVIKEDCRGNYQWADEDAAVYEIELPYSIGAKIIAAPTADTTSFVYTGEEQTYGITATDDYTVDGNKQKDAGTYTVTVSLKDKTNTVWADTEDTEDKTFTFTIAKKTLEKPTAKETSFIYNGKLQKLELNETPYSDLYTLSTNEHKNVGSYNARVTLNQPNNYCWEGETSSYFLIPITIAPKPVTAPTADTSSITYDDNDHTFITLTEEMVLAEGSDAVTQKNAGTYTIKVALKDKNNTVWADTEDTEDKTYTVVINKAEQTAPAGVTAEAESIFKKNDGKIKGLTKDKMEYKLKGAADYITADKANISDLAAGTYLVRFKADDNHNASPDTEVTIAAGEKLKASFVTAGSLVSDQTGLGYGDALTKPETSYDGFTLVGWYKEDSYKHEWNFATDRMGDEDITLYAKWELSIGIEGDARFTEGKAPAEGVKIVVGKGCDLDEATAELKKVTVDGKKLDAENYTVAYGEDGLTITLKQEYLNTLGDDEYEIGVVVNSEHLNGTDRDLSVTLTVDPVQGAAGKPAGKPGKAVKTGDSSDLLLWSVLTLGAGAGLVCIGKKRREN